MRKKFETAMKEAGWTEARDIWGNLYNWEYKTGYRVDDRSAFDFWKMSKLIPAPW